MADQIQVDVDGSPMDFDSKMSFGAISAEVKKKLAPERVVTEVLFNDRYVDLDEEEKMFSQSAEQLGRISFRSKDVAALLKDSVAMAPSICEALLLECDDIETYFAKGEIVAAHERIGEMSALVDWLLQCITGLQSYGDGNFREVPLQEGKVIDSVERMEALLRSLHMKLQTQQFEEFRDILKGAFKNEIKVWKQMFEIAATRWTPRSLKRES